MSKQASHKITVHGKPLNCVVCGHDHFWRREAEIEAYRGLLNKLTEPPAVCHICDKCGYVHWFITHRPHMIGR